MDIFLGISDLFSKYGTIFQDHLQIKEKKMDGHRHYLSKTTQNKLLF